MRKINTGIVLMFLLLIGRSTVSAVAPMGDPVCGWCGRQCTKISPYTRCLTIAAPSNLSCVEELDTCVIRNDSEVKTTVAPIINTSPKPTRILTETPTSCIPRPPCLDGIDDGSGHVKYCVGVPGRDYCPKVILAKEGEQCGLDSTTGKKIADCEPNLVCTSQTANVGSTGGPAGIKVGGSIGVCVKTTPSQDCYVKKIVNCIKAPCEITVCPTTTPANQCSWCGLKCGIVSADQGCPEIAPPMGKSCVSGENGVCVIKNVTPTPPACTERLLCMDEEPACMPDLAVGAPPFCPPNVRGDANGDGKINLVDFDIWKNDSLKKLTSTATDFNKDGKTNIVDFNIWKKAYLANN